MLGVSAHLVTSPPARPFSCPFHVGCCGQVVETVRARLTFRNLAFGEDRDEQPLLDRAMMGL